MLGAPLQWVRRLIGPPSWAINHCRRRECTYFIESLRRKQDKPVTFPGKGRNAVRRNDSVAGMRKEKKRMPRCNGVDTGCVSHTDNITGRESGQTFPWSFTRENLRNRLMRQSKLRPGKPLE